MGLTMNPKAPAMEAVEYQDVQFQNRFNEKSPYRGKPTAELEKAWLDLWNFGPVNIPLHKLKALNKSGDADWQRTKMDKGGGVIGSLEVFHQIHCLDMIRQYTYRDDYDYSKQPAFDGTPEQHVDHCINSLRIFLQCTSDVTPYLILRDPKRPLGIDPDFQTQHKCRNFEKIQEWARKHELDTNDYQNDIS
ncbi:FluG domain-containing protein [Purpureocillium lavendulum]|uniref:FluG domain-containing protein n=1 Tax=Purpureocillium lavendulum TaxID=1247861 RepID=A0AB34FEB5_9HYPO|nr:FluG domain-containing protein [Purpureocillium lavendulum]